MSDLKKLVEQGKSQGGYISYLDFIEYLPPDIVDQDAIDDIISMLKDMGIEVTLEKAEVIKFPKDN